MKKIFIVIGVCMCSYACNKTQSRASLKKDSHSITYTNNKSESKLSEEVSQSEIPQVPILKIFIENSGSMDGFVNGPTEFKNVLFRYVSDILNIKPKIVSSINPYYINSRIIPLKNSIETSILKLSVSEFRKHGGERKDTDIADVISLVLKESQEHDISCIVSDYIFSPGRKFCNNANAYLDQQQNLIYAELIQKINNNSEFSVAILRFNSLFDGVFYNKCNERTTIQEQRPFFIWLLGNRENIRPLISKKVLDPNNTMTPLTHIYTNEQEIDSESIQYAVKYDSSGHYQIDRTNKFKINKAKINPRTGHFTLKININLSKLLVPSEYIMDISNYTLSHKNYNLSINEVAINDKGYTHELIISSDRIIPTNLEISLNKKLPEWVSELSDLDGSNVEIDDNMNKTYGLKQQISAVDDAFKKHNDKYFQIKISIN